MRNITQEFIYSLYKHKQMQNKYVCDIDNDHVHLLFKHIKALRFFQ